MSFVDKVTVSVAAGNGGNGKMSFRHEKFVAHGGPDGGDGGNGGDVILLASRNQNTLAAFRYQKEIQAEHGQPGGKTRKHGRSAEHLLVKVPVGTLATNKAGQVIADLTEDEQQVVIAKGGKGGYGNAHFVSSRRQAPQFAEKGEPGEAFDLDLELKLIADVGLVGLPNAGKSTLLAALSNARPEIADYPFTTLTPNLGVVDVDQQTSILFADIPGLIEGAAGGKGLGHDFLRHIERTAVILHLIDAYQENVAEAYKVVRDELKAYDLKLAKRVELVALTKIDGLDKDIVEDLMGQLKRVVPKRTKLCTISAKSGEGIEPLLYEIKHLVTTVRTKTTEKQAAPKIPVLTLSDTSDKWHIEKKGRTFMVSGQRIERFAIRTDFANDESIQRLKSIMRKSGIQHELTRQGMQPGDRVQIGEQVIKY